LHRVNDDDGERYGEHADAYFDCLIYFGMSHFETYCACRSSYNIRVS
jgi:hypothetical protein